MTVLTQLRRYRLAFTLAGVCVAMLLVGWAVVATLHGAGFGLPLVVYPSKSRSSWMAYGGTWMFTENAIENASDERGAKLITGSPFWQNYAMEADVELEGETGDAGLLLRVQEPDEGVDAFRGIYAGLRLQDNALIAGQADYGWTELAPKTTRIRLQPFTWYHLRVSIAGCRLRATASTMEGRSLTSLEALLPDCSPRGQVGLRSYRSGGSWRNIHVQKIGTSEAGEP